MSMSFHSGLQVNVNRLNLDSVLTHTWAIYFTGYCCGVGVVIVIHKAPSQLGPHITSD